MHKTGEALPPFEYVTASICKMPAVIEQIKQWINYSGRIFTWRVAFPVFSMIDFT
jgi:hypothetical protein